MCVSRKKKEEGALDREIESMREGGRERHVYEYIYIYIYIYI